MRNVLTRILVMITGGVSTTSDEISPRIGNILRAGWPRTSTTSFIIFRNRTRNPTRVAKDIQNLREGSLPVRRQDAVHQARSSNSRIRLDNQQHMVGS